MEKHWSRSGAQNEPPQTSIFAERYASNLVGVVEGAYTTAREFSRAVGEEIVGMAFVRRKGNAWYLVHNVRRQGKVKQLHLARLGERPRITDDVVRKVSRSHPMLDVDWPQLREVVENRVELFEPRSEFVHKLVRSLRTVNLDLADLFPTLLKWGISPESSGDLITQLRLLRSTVDVKLSQFEESARPQGAAGRRFR